MGMQTPIKQQILDMLPATEEQLHESLRAAPNYISRVLNSLVWDGKAVAELVLSKKKIMHGFRMGYTYYVEAK